jgi:hypothetical protein
MRRITSILALIGLFAFQACEGPIGPVGPQGPQGPQGANGAPGVNVVSEVFEVEVDFTKASDYEAVFEFTPPIVNSDVVLIFIEWERAGQTPIWRALPQTVFFDEGVLMYNYDFTRADFRVFLDGPLDFSLLSNDWTQDQRFRVVVVPGDFTGSRIDWTNYEAVIELLGVTEEDFLKVKLKQKD